ncbi:MAG TPA: membrane protein insertion efficiency factor YidD [Syntrophobacteraceae bacterium]|nr:membrane protein insertion efficiency factor YidD [Syntrophobacteraceae bacterium]
MIRLIFLGLIRSYQILVSPLFPRACRFSPTCSHYALDAIRMHGISRGTYLGLRRILRCHPFNPGGYDPVPVKAKEKRQRARGRSLLLFAFCFLLF